MLKQKFIQFWEDESAQGAVEYILILVIVVAIAMTFRTQIMEIISGKTQQLGNQISGFGE